MDTRSDTRYDFISCVETSIKSLLMRFLDDAKTNIAILLTKERLLHSQVNRGRCKVMLGGARCRAGAAAPSPLGKRGGLREGALWWRLFG